MPGKVIAVFPFWASCELGQVTKQKRDRQVLAPKQHAAPYTFLPHVKHCNENRGEKGEERKTYFGWELPGTGRAVHSIYPWSLQFYFGWHKINLETPTLRKGKKELHEMKGKALPVYYFLGIFIFFLLTMVTAGGQAGKDGGWEVGKLGGWEKDKSTGPAAPAGPVQVKDKKTAPSLQSQPGNPAPKGKKEKEKENFILKIALGIIVGVVLFILGIVFQKFNARRQRSGQIKADKAAGDKERKAKAKTYEEHYKEMLSSRLGTIDLLGSPDIRNKTVNLDDAFVSLSISHHWESGGCLGDKREQEQMMLRREAPGYFGPEEVLKQAHDSCRLLIIIGDPGSGKTTLMKFYVMRCLKGNKKALHNMGVPTDVLPLFLPLRDIEDMDGGGAIAPLPENLARWTLLRQQVDIPPEQFDSWLRNRHTLVLLDGLDEISSLKRRRKVCQWIDGITGAFGKKACFIVTSRGTGFRKLDKVDLASPYVRADIMDFSLEQQALFLKKWFRAVFARRLPGPGIDAEQWRAQQWERGEQVAEEVSAFLNREDNRLLRQLTAVPVLLQILACIWEQHGYRPRTRSQLYHTALNYLLGHRDEARNMEVFLDPDGSRRVLAPAALWMQQRLKKEEVGKKEFQAFLQPHLDTLPGQPGAAEFCRYLEERAGVVSEYDPEHYVFRHKTFREYLAAGQLRKAGTAVVPKLVGCFKDDWWEETIRFFMSECDPEIFDVFMDNFFRHAVSEELNALQLGVLVQIVREAPQKKIDALVRRLKDEPLSDNRRRYILDCLNAVGTPEAMTAVKKVNKETWARENRERAEDIVEEKRAISDVVMGAGEAFKEMEAGAGSFRNPFDGNVEYLNIPGGTFSYSLEKEKQTVPDAYVCKYLVTNERYQRFIDYLAGKERDVSEILPMKRFRSLLLEFAAIAKQDGDIAKGYREHLGEEPSGWPEKLSSRFRDDKKFNGAQQPVAGVSWYGARAYCLWLSCLEAAKRDESLLKDVRRLSRIYRLPTETEWEWAAGGNPDGTVRDYPWGKAEPSPELANYGRNVGHTTPVGNYPDGATPLGLMDMAGNAWEWMDNYYDKDKDWLALRGGSWDLIDYDLRCSARNGGHPHHWDISVGFRPFRPSQIF